MDAQVLSELVARWVSGDRLAPAEQQSLLEWLESHPEARHELLQDEALDSLLRCWPRLDDTAEDFVRNCLRRATGGRTDQCERVSAVAAPPVVAPPVVVVCPPKSAGDARRSRRLFTRGAGRWVAAVAGCSVALLLGAIGWRWLTRGPKAIETNQPAMPFARSHDSRPEPAGAFATLAQSAGAAWETPLSAGDRLAASLLKLTAGTAELHFDKGTIARLSGPAVLELRNGDEVFLKRGSLTAKVPPRAVGFLVATPLSRIVDLGTEFDVVVEDLGATQTLVRRGKVSLRPQRGQEELGTPIELAVGALDRATVSVPDIAASVLPVTTIASGSEGRFLGRLSAGGKTAEFHSPTAFYEFQAQAFKQLREAPGQFGEKWPALVDGAGGDITAQNKSTAEHRLGPGADIAHRGEGNVEPGAAADDQTVEVQEDGKTIAITDSKESGITVTVTELVAGEKKMTKVQAADLPELAKKNPNAHRLYGKYFHHRPKGGKPK